MFKLITKMNSFCTQGIDKKLFDNILEIKMCNDFSCTGNNNILNKTLIYCHII